MINIFKFELLKKTSKNCVINCLRKSLESNEINYLEAAPISWLSYFESISVATWKLSTIMSIKLMAIITLGMWMLEPFHNKSGVIVSRENAWTNNYGKSLLTKQPILVSKRNSIEMEIPEIFDCTLRFSLQSLIYTIRFLYSLFSQIMTIWKLLYLFRSVGSNFFANFFDCKGKPLFRFVETVSFIYS